LPQPHGRCDVSLLPSARPPCAVHEESSDNDVCSEASTAASVDFSDTSNDSPKALMESPDMHLHNDSLCPQNQFLRKQLHDQTCQLHQQQEMVRLLMKQLEEERETNNNMENALLELLYNGQLPADFGLRP